MLIKNKLSEDYKLHTASVSLGKLYELLDVEPTPMQLGLIDLWDNNLRHFSEVNIFTEYTKYHKNNNLSNINASCHSL